MGLEVQIHPYISPTMKEALDKECKERRVSQGDIIEAALRAFLDPRQEDVSRYEVILKQLASLRALILETWGQETFPSPPRQQNTVSESTPQETSAGEASPRIATYEEMYSETASWIPLFPEVTPSNGEQPGVPQKRGWVRRMFLKDC